MLAATGQKQLISSLALMRRLSTGLPTFATGNSGNNFGKKSISSLYKRVCNVCVGFLKPTLLDNLRAVCCLLVGCLGRKVLGRGVGKEGSGGDMQERNRTGGQERRPGGYFGVTVAQCYSVTELQWHCHLMASLGPLREGTHKAETHRKQ